MKNIIKINLAKFISELFNPIILAIVILLCAVYKSDMPQQIALRWYLIILVLNFIIPGTIYYFLTNKGYVFDDSLKNEKVKKQRILLMLIFLFATILEIILLFLSEELYQPLYAILVGGLVSITFSSAISYFWKISLHSSIITLFVMMIIFLFGYQYWIVILLIPIVWWARIVLDRHNIFQLIAGFILSVLLVFLAFSYYGLI